MTLNDPERTPTDPNGPHPCRGPCKNDHLCTATPEPARVARAPPPAVVCSALALLGRCRPTVPPPSPEGPRPPSAATPSASVMSGHRCDAVAGPVRQLSQAAGGGGEEQGAKGAMHGPGDRGGNATADVVVVSGTVARGCGSQFDCSSATFWIRLVLARCLAHRLSPTQSKFYHSKPSSCSSLLQGRSARNLLKGLPSRLCAYNARFVLRPEHIPMQHRGASEPARSASQHLNMSWTSCSVRPPTSFATPLSHWVPFQMDGGIGFEAWPSASEKEVEKPVIS